MSGFFLAKNWHEIAYNVDLQSDITYLTSLVRHWFYRFEPKNNIMNQDEITMVIKDAFPQLSETIKRKGAINNIYTLMATFTSFTKEKLALHDLRNTIRSIKLMDKLYSKGDHILRNAIESIFVFSFSQMRGNCTSKEWKTVQAAVPLTLYSLYIRQIYQSGH